MAGEGYLKAGAGNIRRAAQALQQDISDLRDQLSQAEQDTRRQIDEISKAINNNNLWVGRPNATGQERAERLRQNGRLDSDIVDRKHELAALRQQVQERIAGLEREIYALNNQAAQLDQRAASMTS